MLLHEVGKRKEFLCKNGLVNRPNRCSTQEEMEWNELNLLCQCVSHDDIVWVIGLFANPVGYICRLRSSRSIFQTSEIGFDFIEVHFELHLMWKCDVRLGVLCEAGISGAINHYSKIRVRL